MSVVWMGVELQLNVPRSEATKSGQDKVQRPQVNVQEGQRLMIIELRKYSEVRELLIWNYTTGLLEQVIYWDTGPEGICN